MCNGRPQRIVAHYRRKILLVSIRKGFFPLRSRPELIWDDQHVNDQYDETSYYIKKISDLVYRCSKKESLRINI